MCVQPLVELVEQILHFSTFAAVATLEDLDQVEIRLDCAHLHIQHVPLLRVALALVHQCLQFRPVLRGDGLATVRLPFTRFVFFDHSVLRLHVHLLHLAFD